MTPLPPQQPPDPPPGTAASVTTTASNTTPANVAAASGRATTAPSLVPQGLPSYSNRAPLPLPSTSVHLGGVTTTAAVNTNAAAAATASAGVVLPPPSLPLRVPPPSVALEAHVHASLPGPQGGLPAGASSVAAPWLPLPAHPSPGDLWTPEVFRNRRLRSGKWIREEEIYAEALIDLFEKGLASDCTSGCTLRAYLSKKLHCAPMRISKKYAGKGIGKLAFVPQAAVAGAEPSSAAAAKATSSNDNDDAVKLQEAQVQKKAEAFYLAVFQCNEYLGVPLGFLFGPAPAAAPPPAALPYTSVATAPAQAVVPPPLLFGATAPAPVPTTLPPATAAGANTSLPPVVPHTAVLPNTQHHHSTLRLQQTYLNALQQQQQQQASTAPAQLLLLPTQPQTQSNSVLLSHGMSGTTALPPWGVPAPQQPVASAPAPLPSPAPQGAAPPPAAPVDPLRDLASTHQAPDFLTGFDRVALSLKPASSGGGSGSDHSALPAADGAADQQPHRLLPPALPQADANSSLLHCSPTFTSRSFDDFHRFLGQDLVSLDASPFHKTQHQRNHSSGAVAVAHTNGTSSAPFPVHDMNGSQNPPHKAPPIAATTAATAQQHQELSVRGDPSEARALFSTESYAVFASAAVAASSQHAAYLHAPGLLGAPPPGLLGSVAHGQGNSHPSHHHGSGSTSSGARGRSDTFDVETTMDLVSAHLQPSRQQQQQQERRSSHDSRGASAPKTRTYHCNSVTFPKTRESLLERMYGPRLSNLVSGSEPSTTSSSSSGAENESGQEGGGSEPSSSASSTGAASESEDVHTDHSHSEEHSSDSDHTGDSECDESSTLPKKQQQQQHHHVPKCKKAKTSSSCLEAAAVEQTYGG